MDEGGSFQRQKQQQQQTQTTRQQQQSAQILSSGLINGPRTVILQRHNGDFGFTLRHFIVYPPEVTDPSVVDQLEAAGFLSFVQPMDTIFVKKVHPESQAFYAGLKEGDRLLAVNGIPVAGNQYADVVNAIQKTPKTLTLQVVPKCYDILQTFFSDTAHNPETNQRPQPQTPLVLQQQHSPAAQMTMKASTMSQSRLLQPQPLAMSSQTQQSFVDKQESLYSTLQELAASRNLSSSLVYAEPQQQQMFMQKSSSQQQPHSLQMYKQKENIPQINLYGVDVTSPGMGDSKSLMSNNSSELSDSVIMSRLRKSLEQKEEFLRRPSQSFGYSLPQAGQSMTTQKAQQQDVPQHREFYARPNRLKPMWPPSEFNSNLGQPKLTITSTSSQDLSTSSASNLIGGGSPSYSNSRLSNQLALREQFFNSPYSPPPSTYSLIKSASPTPMYSSTPTSPHLLEQTNQSISGSAGNIIEKSISSSLNTAMDIGDKRMSASPSPVSSSTNSSSVPVYKIVDNLTKQFESGRPLSPDGIDRTAFHKSELSRLNTKQAVPNVALRRQVFEMKAENSSWRRSTDEKQRSSSADSDSRRTSIRTRSLSAESSKDTRSNSTISTRDKLDILGDEKNGRPKPVRENSYLTAVRNNPDHSSVVLRSKSEQRRNDQMMSDEDERKTRRISYLRATANDIDSDVDNSPVSQTPDTPDEDTNVASHQLKSHPAKSKALTYFRDQPTDASAPVTREGTLHVKVTLIDGKRSQDRTWRTVHAELKGNLLKLTILREGKLTGQSPEPYGGTIDLTNFHVSDGNYTKRKNVFRLSSANYPSSSTSQTSNQQLCGYERELLIQAQNPQDMALWMTSMKGVCKNSRTSSADFLNGLGGQQAEPQRIAAVQSVQLTSTASGTDEFSPILPTKTVRKYLGSRSPSGQSPVTKSRKTPQGFSVSLSAVTTSASSSAVYSKEKDNSDRETGSPKQKSWKNFVTQQFKKIQNPSESGSGHHHVVPEGASIGVPLSLCPPSEENMYVPLIVAKCTKVVETKGANIVGIYRIPGNTAAITALSETVNRNGLDEQTLNDPRWEDVNVVSSLLKLFIRSLPEPILPNELYSSLINADKLTDQVQRFNEIKMLLKKLPPHNYETLKHLIRHLNRVSQNCLNNLMEPRNLAIVFGPSIVRKSNDSLETVVKDMRHQCCIVESLVTHYLFFFENDPLPKLKEKDHQSIAESSSELPSAEFLLENVAKIEQSLPFPAFNKESTKDSSSRFMANIVQAANRKIRRTAQRRSTTSSMTPDTLSLDSTTSTESKEQSIVKQQRYLNEHKTMNIQSNESLLSTARSSEEDSNDSAFTDNGSMSLTTVTALLDNKLRSLRNSSVDSEKDVLIEEKPKVSPVTTTVVITPSLNTLTSTSQRPLYSHLTYQSNSNNSNINRPLTLGENIPFADESPERPLIQARIKPMRVSNKVPGTSNNVNIKKESPSILQSQSQVNIQQSSNIKDLKNDSMASSSSTLSEDTDASTTSNPREKFVSAIRLDTEVLRKVNRILTNLEHLERKYSLNRSLSLNYKNHRNNECCCNHYNHSHHNFNNSHSTNIHGSNNIRLSLTKDEKTDKNINKRRQLIDNQVQQSGGTSASTNRRRHLGSSRIRRRHTVGGTQDYYPNAKINAGNCQSYINKHHNIPYKTSKTSNNDDSSDENKSDGN